MIWFSYNAFQFCSLCSVSNFYYVYFILSYKLDKYFPYWIQLFLWKPYPIIFIEDFPIIFIEAFSITFMEAFSIILMEAFSIIFLWKPLLNLSTNCRVK